eukprot:CAMPEP_0114615568 /NCGR_PEP_ID=MMETSP0168-20121206/6231_1 /TAXON_ID=95228 ORGANISM="Vannella sp., Strain DIVA3 517/6/12" /NCGR_SAMPLE_ID=MMETSP0168 /ASSEMBLY_ACC=CAM_ASM_000044 /LENGTH=530 /DNA_ID=CAMNT_0001826641 /DNA_START=125 /DNA_END=1714 /DNA_ORIENTATION=+
MEVTADNFAALLPRMEAALAACDFVAFDLEMTGLHAAGHAKPTKFDPPHDRYATARESARNFLPVQLGLCAFSWNAAAEQYEAVPFNLYLFPRPQGRSSATFLAEISSIRFLSENGFDFNKLFAQGIPYASRAEEARLRQPRRASDIVLSGNDAKFFEDTCEYIEGWLASESGGKTTELLPCNSYLLRALYQDLPARFPQLHLSSRKGEGYSKVMVLSRLSEEERRAAEEKKEREREEALREQVGARLVFDALVRAQKPLVGHNMLLDVCHLFEAFLGPLPESAEEFRAELHSCFPVIFDTKYFGSYCDLLGREFRSTGLDELYTATRDKPKYSAPPIQFAEGYDMYSGAPSKCHEAAYDAYSTGFVFAKLSHFVLSKEAANNVTPASDLLATWANRIYLARSSDSFNMTSLHGRPAHAHVYYVFGFAESTTTSDLLQWFSFAGKGQVSWKTDRSAFVSLPRATLPEEEVVRRCAAAKECSVMSYRQYLASASGGDGDLRLSGSKRTRGDDGAPGHKKKREDESGSSCAL